MKINTQIKNLNKEALFILLLWSSVIGGSLFWNFDRESERVLQLAEVEALTNLKKDRAFRLWGVKMGGFYIKVTDEYQPSPFMQHIAERDVTTDSGQLLTLYSPAIIMRLLMEAQEEFFGIKARITGEKFLNPVNAPDEWERKSLKIVKKTLKDFSEIIAVDGQLVLRYMQPMIMQESCVECHAWTEIKVGELRGATDIAIPLAPYQLLEQTTRLNLIISHSILWLLGISFIVFFSYRKKVYLKELHQQHTELQHEIHKRTKTEQKLLELAFKDILTKLPNRQLFYDRIDYELKRALRNENAKLALLFIDLDHFKQVNDTQGHQIGDDILKIMAQRILGCVREKDTVARLGGDEFTIILTDISSSKIASDIAENIIKELSVPVKLQSHEYFLGASIGISLFPEDSVDRDILIRNADVAMYHAKECGRGNHQFFSEEINLRNQKRRELDEDIRKAIINNEFELYFQPQIETTAEKIIGAEVLIRWNHPSRGIVSPVEFIPVAEQNGMIIEIGEWVFKQACKHLHKCLTHCKQAVPIAINLSAVQFSDDGLINMIQSTLQQEKISNQLIELEITESAIMENADKAIDIINGLTQLGIRISIDDFGTGYSSLAYLKKFSVNKLKIDREFIKHLPHDKEDAVLTTTMIMLAHNLGLDVLAEGAETKEQVDFLMQHGCTLVQGYYYSKPLPEDEYISYVASMMKDKK